MQMEPQPMPTRSPSTPASIKFLAWAAVTTGDGGSRQRNVRIARPHPAQEYPRVLFYLPQPKVLGQAHATPLPGTTSLPRSSEGLKGYPALTIPPNHLEVGVLLLDIVHHGNLIH